ncbi:MAG: flagellar hook-length control protein FliK, partial [Paracoccaceae bacterium]
PAPPIRSAGTDHVIAQALFERALPTVPLPASTTAQTVVIQTTRGLVNTSPRAPVQDMPVLDDILPEDTAPLAGTVATKTGESRTTELPMFNGVGDGPDVLPDETAVLMPGEPFAEPSQIDVEAVQPAFQQVMGHQSVAAVIERAAEIPSVKFADLSAAIGRAAVEGAPQTTTTLQIDPIELGTVAFNMDTGPAGLIVTITAERPETLDLLRRNAEQFLGDLRQSGFLGASLQFGQSGAGHSGQQDQSAQRYSQTAAHHPHISPPAIETVSQGRRQTVGQALDLRL